MKVDQLSMTMQQKLTRHNNMKNCTWFCTTEEAVEEESMTNLSKIHTTCTSWQPTGESRKRLNNGFQRQLPGGDGVVFYAPPC